MNNIPLSQEFPCKTFSSEEWGKYPKEGFREAIRSWCAKHNFVENVGTSGLICTRLPYKSIELSKNSYAIEAAIDFLEIAERVRFRGKFKK